MFVLMAVVFLTAGCNKTYSSDFEHYLLKYVQLSVSGLLYAIYYHITKCCLLCYVSHVCFLSSLIKGYCGT